MPIVRMLLNMIKNVSYRKISSIIIIVNHHPAIIILMIFKAIAHGSVVNDKYNTIFEYSATRLVLLC